MPGEKDLEVLLKSMQPDLKEKEYVFVSLYSTMREVIDLDPWAMIKEKEGLTLILEKQIADSKDIVYESEFKLITLNIHSSLDAVGLTAAISNKLADSGVSANVVAGYYHDHIFVQAELADRAMKLLLEFTI